MSDQRAFAPNFHKTISHPAWRDVCALFAAYDALEGVVGADDVRAYLLDKATTRLRGGDMVAQASGLCGAATVKVSETGKSTFRSRLFDAAHRPARARGKGHGSACLADTGNSVVPNMVSEERTGADAPRRRRPGEAGLAARQIFTNLFHNPSRTQALAKHESDKQQARNVINEIQAGHRRIGKLLAEAREVLV